MSALWVVMLLVALVGAAALAALMRRTRDEVTPTVRAFSEFRAALRPAIADLRAEADAVAGRLDGDHLDRDAARDRRDRHQEPGLV